MKVKYCGCDDCQESCMPRWASIICVGIGVLAAGGLSAYRLGYITLSENFVDYATQEAKLAGIAIIAIMGLAIFLSLFERFEHYITAIIFGVSMPGLLYTIATLGAVQ